MSLQTTQCPAWEYENVPGYDKVVYSAAHSEYMNIWSEGPTKNLSRLQDTRFAHHRMFHKLTPPGHSYYAGNYRGIADYTCLKIYSVKVGGDELVGHDPGSVPFEMEQLKKDIDQAVSTLDAEWKMPNVQFQPEQKLARIAEITAEIFVYFLEIHPYANGNGHMARMIIVAALARYGFPIDKFSIHPKPSPSNYSNAIYRFRRGERKPFIQFILSCI